MKRIRKKEDGQEGKGKRTHTKKKNGRIMKTEERVGIDEKFHIDL